MTDKAIGTVYYISPEQASGKPIDPRSDLYSLGVVMYEMATGRLPFVADSPVSVALMQVNNQPVRPREINPSIPVGLEQIILAAMEKNPDRRLQSATQMLRHIMQIKSDPGFVFKTRRTAAEQTGETVRPGQGKRKRPKHQSRSMLPIISGVTAAFLIVIGISAAYVLTKLFDPNAANAPKTIAIPALEGNVWTNELEKELQATQYYNINKNYVYNANYDVNVIISQEPGVGEKRKVIAGSQLCDLTVTISKGAQTLALPDYTMLEYRSVKIQLQSLSLIPNIQEEYNATIPDGYVIRTEPAPGNPVHTGDPVTIYVSKGQQITYVIVPDFREMTESKAMEKLIANNLSFGGATYEASDIYPKGTIISQSKTPFSETAEKSPIYFVVSSGPADTGEDTVAAE